MPWLGLIALMIVAIVALITLAALAWAIVFVPYMLSRGISRRWHGRTGAIPRTAAVLRVYGHPHAYAGQRRIDYRTPQLVPSPDSTSVGGRDGAPGPLAFRGSPQARTLDGQVRARCRREGARWE